MGLVMLNAFILAERAKLNYSNLNQIDLFLSQKLRSYLTQACETGNFLQLYDAPDTLPAVHSLARQGLLRCIDVMSDFFSSEDILDQNKRNYFHYLIEMKKYALANKMIDRWKITGDATKLTSMVGRQKAKMIVLLARAVRGYDKEAIVLLRSLLSAGEEKYQESKSPLESISEKQKLAMLKAAFKSYKKANQPLLEKINGKINKFWKKIELLRHFLHSLNWPLGSPSYEKLNEYEKDFAELKAEFARLQIQQPLDNETAEKWSLFSECRVLFKSYTGEKLYHQLDTPDEALKKIRYLR